jgi:hypothetical protein
MFNTIFVAKRDTMSWIPGAEGIGEQAKGCGDIGLKVLRQACYHRSCSWLVIALQLIEYLGVDSLWGKDLRLLDAS